MTHIRPLSVHFQPTDAVIRDEGQNAKYRMWCLNYITKIDVNKSLLNMISIHLRCRTAVLGFLQMAITMQMTRRVGEK